eukprot:5143795-Alexandrium_andersonii.AAC.1
MATRASSELPGGSARGPWFSLRSKKEADSARCCSHGSRIWQRERPASSLGVRHVAPGLAPGAREKLILR